MLKKILDISVRAFEAFIYVICYLFLISLGIAAIVFIIKIAIEYDVVKNYIIGISIIIFAMLSIMYIMSYNKKYKKNDSNSPERPDYFLFEGDLSAEKGHKIDRRNVE